MPALSSLHEDVPARSKYPSGTFQPLTGNTEPMTDETSGPFRLLSGRGDAPVGYGAGHGFCSTNWGRGHGRRLELFAPLVARYGLKNVPTPIEIIAELACHAGAVTKSGALGTPSC